MLNNTYIVNPTTVATFRFGMNTFADDNSLPFDFDPQVARLEPRLCQCDSGAEVSVADAHGLPRHGILPASTDRNYYSYGVNGTVTRLAGAHSFKLGADYRMLGVDAMNFGQSAGSYTFNGQFTGSAASNPATTSRNAIADLLLGYPSSGTFVLNSDVNNYIKYYSVYAAGRLADHRQADAQLRRPARTRDRPGREGQQAGGRL